MKLFRGQGSQMPGTPRRWSLALRYVGENRRYKCLRNLHLIPILPAGEFNPSEPDFLVKQGQFTGLHFFGKGWGSGGEGTMAGLVLEGTNTAASGQAVFPSWCQRQDPVGGMSTQRGTPARWFGFWLQQEQPHSWQCCPKAGHRSSGRSFQKMLLATTLSLQIHTCCGFPRWGSDGAHQPSRRHGSHLQRCVGDHSPAEP